MTRLSPARWFALAVTAAMLAALIPPVGPASAAVDPGCPEILSRAAIHALAPGTPLTALTVEAGDTPSAIDFEVEHVQRNALPDGAPLVVARATSGSPAEGKGIWFGMSGSPVYTVDAAGEPDALVGAVAYGLSWEGDSTIAGLQPAYMMERVRQYPSTTVTAPTVKLSDSGARAVAASTGLTVAAASRFEPLTLPLTMSGLEPARLDLVQRAANRAGLRVELAAAGPAARATTATPASVEAGDNFVGALSYGYLTAAGIGTTTYRCDGYAMAFGHPFLHAGRSTFGANAGTDAYVVRDKLGGSYKMATVGGRVGLIDQDRGAGIRAALGGDVPLFPVTSNLQAPDIGKGGRARTDVAESSEATFFPVLHLLSHLDNTADHLSDGSSALRWTITGETQRGAKWELQRGNRYTSPFDITFESIFDMFDDLITLQSNPFTKVKFTGVHITGSVFEDVMEYRVMRVRVRRNGAWRLVDRLRVTPGELLKLRVVLNTGEGREIVRQDITVPRRARGFGQLMVSGRSGDFDEFDAEEMFLDCGFGECDEAWAEPSSFKELVAMLAKAPRNDVLTTRVMFFDEDMETGEGSFTERTRRQRMDRVVTGSVDIPLLVRRR